MYISEATFPHLMAARDARIADELERRRVIDERRAEERPAGTAAIGAGSAAPSGWALLRRHRRQPRRPRCATC